MYSRTFDWDLGSHASSPKFSKEASFVLTHSIEKQQGTPFLSLWALLKQRCLPFLLSPFQLVLHRKFNSFPHPDILFLLLRSCQ